MTIGNTSVINNTGPYLNWYFGGYGQPTAGTTRTWEGSDGTHRVNSYDCTYRNWYQGHYTAAREKLKFSWPPGWHTVCGPEVYQYYTFVFPDRPSQVTGGAELPAIDNLISKILKHDFQLNLTLGEAPETLKYIYDKLSPIVKSIKYLKKGDVRRAFRALGIKKVNGSWIKGFRKSLRMPHEYWLEYRYAIMPLIGDVNAGMGYLDSLIGKPHSAKVRGGSRYFPNLPPGGIYMGQSQYWPERSMVEYSSAGCTISEGFDYQAIDWQNPYTVTWELLPFSFVIDWSLKIGDYLRSRWFFNLSDYSMGYISSMLKYDSGNYSGGYEKTYISQVICKDGGDWAKSFDECVITRRRSLSGSNIPFPVVLNPLTEDGHWKRLVDSIALLTGLSQSSQRKFAR